MPHAAVNGTNIYYHESGHGLPVVLLHGFPLDHRIWHNQVHDLSHVCRVITPDLRGFGHSHRRRRFHHRIRLRRIYILYSRRSMRCRAFWAECLWVAMLLWRMNGNLPVRFAG